MLTVYLVGCAIAGHDVLKTVALGGIYFGNVVQAWNLAPVRQSGLFHLWSLAEEEQFYLVWPLLLLLLVRSRRRLVPYLVALLAVMLTYKVALTLATDPSWVRLMYGPDTHSDGLVFGAVLAAIRFNRGGLNVPEWFGNIGVAVVALGAILGWASVVWLVYGLPFFELGAVLLIAAAVSDTEVARMLRSRPLVGVGKISYSLYLWHVPVWLALAGVTGSRLVLTASALVISLACAFLSYRFVEQPFRRRRHAVAEVPAPAPAASVGY